MTWSVWARNRQFRPEGTQIIQQVSSSIMRGKINACTIQARTNEGFSSHDTFVRGVWIPIVDHANASPSVIIWPSLPCEGIAIVKFQFA
jgi:hypothetical protein